MKAPAPALVESEADPHRPGRVAYRITSLYSPEAVQRCISKLMEGADVQAAQFTRPQRIRGIGIAAQWGSLGYVVRELETVP